MPAAPGPVLCGAARPGRPVPGAGSVFATGAAAPQVTREVRPGCRKREAEEGREASALLRGIPPCVGCGSAPGPARPRPRSAEGLWGCAGVRSGRRPRDRKAVPGERHWTPRSFWGPGVFDVAGDVRASDREMVWSQEKRKWGKESGFERRRMETAQPGQGWARPGTGGAWPRWNLCDVELGT